MRLADRERLRATMRRGLLGGSTLLRLDQAARALGPPGIRVMNLHGTHPRTAANFAAQLDWVQRHFEVLDPAAYLAILDGRMPPPRRRAVVFTFDDGLASNAEVAAPLLEERGLRAIFFVNPAFCELSGEAARAFFTTRVRPSWDPTTLDPVDYEPMTPATLRDLRRRGHVIGNHTTSHQDLRKVSGAALDVEIRGGRDRLSAWLAEPVQCFAWTFAWNAITPEAWKLALDTHRYCFTACAGNNADADPGCIWRTNTEADLPPYEYRFFYSGLVDRVWAARRGRLAEMRSRAAPRPLRPIRFRWVTNIPTPYRNHLFERMAEILPRRGIDIQIVFTAWTEPKRPWNFDRAELRYPWRLHQNPVPPLAARGIHVNPTLISELRRERPDVVMIGGWGSPTHAAAAYLLPPEVIKILGSETHAGSQTRTHSLATAIKRAVVKQYDAFIVPGTKSHDLICDLDPDAVVKPWLKLPNVVDARLYRDRVDELRTSRDQLRAQLGIPANRQVWLIPSRLSPEKGIQEFLPRITGLRDIEVLIAGDGPLRDALQTLIDAWRLPVRLLGHQPEERLLELYAASDLFVLPSLADASPLAAVEAAAAGLPLLLSDRAGNCVDLVVDGVNGWILDMGPRTRQARLLETIARIRNAELASMGKRSRARYEADFDTDRCVEWLAEFVIRLVQARRPR